MVNFNPLHAHARDRLFATHPATANRVAALEAMAGSRAAAPGRAVAGSSVPLVGRRR